MSNNKKINANENQRIIDSYDYLSDSASSQECTGLMYAPPLNEEEIESYNEVYKFRPPLIPSPKK